MSDTSFDRELQSILPPSASARPARGWLLYSSDDFAVRVIFVLLAFLITKDFLFSTVLKISIPGLNTISLLTAATALILTQKPKIIWNRTHLFLLILFSLYTVYNHVAVHFEPHRLLGGWNRTVQPALVFAFFYLIRLPDRKITQLIRWVVFLILLFLAQGIFEGIFVLQNPFQTLTRWTRSFYSHENYQPAWLSLGVVLSLYLYQRNQGKKFFAIAVLFFIALMMAAMRKSVLAAVLVFIVHFISFGSPVQKVRNLVVAVLAFSLYLFLFGGFLIERTKNLDQYSVTRMEGMAARTAMNVTGVQIAADYFPFGSGLGTFASYPAAVDYSPLYYDYHLDHIYGLNPPGREGGYSSYLMDTYWPHIIAELGVAGILLFLLLWMFPLSLARRRKRTLSKPTLFLIGGCWLAIFMESMGATYPEQMQFMIIYCGLPALLLREAVQRSSDG